MSTNSQLELHSLVISIALDARLQNLQLGAMKKLLQKLAPELYDDFHNEVHDLIKTDASFIHLTELKDLAKTVTDLDQMAELIRQMREN